MRPITGILLTITGCILLSAQRIVTMAPALTEIVYALGQGDKIVGNTTFCDYPEQAKTIKKVGAYTDLNLEALIALKPDIIILYPEVKKKIAVMKQWSNLVVVEHTSLQNLYDSINTIATVLKSERLGQTIVKKIKTEMEDIKNKCQEQPIKNTLLVAGRTVNKLSDIYIIGRNDFLNEILEICGGKNAYNGPIPYPSISFESVLKMDPDCIIDLSSFNQNMENRAQRVWDKYPIIRSVETKNVLIISDPVWLRPGPRIVRIAEKLVSFLHKGTVARN